MGLLSKIINYFWLCPVCVCVCIYSQSYSCNTKQFLCAITGAICRPFGSYPSFRILYSNIFSHFISSNDPYAGWHIQSHPRTQTANLSIGHIIVMAPLVSRLLMDLSPFSIIWCWWSEVTVTIYYEKIVWCHPVQITNLLHACHCFSQHFYLIPKCIYYTYICKNSMGRYATGAIIVSVKTLSFSLSYKTMANIKKNVSLQSLLRWSPLSVRLVFSSDVLGNTGQIANAVSLRKYYDV